MIANTKSPSGYRLTEQMFIGGDGGWDYLIVDDVARRLYVTHDSRVHVIDVDKLVVIGEIQNTDGVHGVTFARDVRLGFTSNGRAHTVSVFNLDTLRVIDIIPVGRNPDSIRFDPASNRVFTFNGDSHDSTVIDPVARKVVATIPLGGKPEFAIIDGKGLLYVNNEDRNLVHVIDTRALKVLNEWPLGIGEIPTGLALDMGNRRLFSVCRNKWMVVMDANKGNVIASLPIGSGTDGCVFDPTYQYAFSSNRDGTLTVVHEASPAVFTVIDTLTTMQGSRTMTIDPKTHALFVPGAEFGPTPLPSPTNPKGRPPVLKDTFKIMKFQR